MGRWGDRYVLASETCAFDAIGAEMLRDIAPGEMIIITKEGIKSLQVLPSHRSALCIFEFIYFSRPDSNIGGKNVHSVRKKLGNLLAREHPVEADIVTGVPVPALPLLQVLPKKWALLRNGIGQKPYIGHAFIQPWQDSRNVGVQ